eukprot:81711-Prorocentrum_minimum.AAC.1
MREPREGNDETNQRPDGADPSGAGARRQASETTGGGNDEEKRRKKEEKRRKKEALMAELERIRQ